MMAESNNSRQVCSAVTLSLLNCVLELALNKVGVTYERV